jgi:hypothetical protein
LPRVGRVLLAVVAAALCGAFLLVIALAFTNSSFPWWLGLAGFVGAFVWLYFISESSG